jgi:hypothetical protein
MVPHAVEEQQALLSHVDEGQSKRRTCGSDYDLPFPPMLKVGDFEGALPLYERVQVRCDVGHEDCVAGGGGIFPVDRPDPSTATQAA